MDAEVIKSFLVGLGFGVDEKELAAFNKAILSATLKVTALYGSIKLASAGIFAAISGVSQSFEDLGYQLRIVAPAVNRWLVLRQALLEAYSKAGVNLTKVVQQSILFNYSLAKTKFALEAVYKSVAAKFFPILTKQLDIFRLRIYANMPKIQKALQGFIQLIFKAFEATSELGSRVYSILLRVWDFFVKLDKATHGWSTAILGAVAAWKFLNLSFLATPLGIIIAGFTTLLTLLDDFLVFREGGKHLIDWGNDFTKVIVGLATALAGLATIWLGVKAATLGWAAATKIAAAVQAGFNLVLLANPLGLLLLAIGAITAALTILDAKWKLFGGKLSDFFGSLGSKVLDFIASASGIVDKVGPSALNSLSGANPNAALSLSRPAPIIAPQTSSSANIHQQTHINVNGAADANQVGKTVINAQDRVNFDMTRNMKGALQ